MTQKEILEFNRRCAEFLGYKSQERVVNTSFYEDNKPTRKLVFELGVKKYSIDKLQYHSNWNWIMQVVEAIEKKSEHIIIGRPLYNSFDIGNRNIKFYFSPDNKYLLQLELQQVLSDEPWLHTMYKHHIVKEFDFRNKGKKAAVVEAINQFLIWYENAKK